MLGTEVDVLSSVYCTCKVYFKT